MDYNTNLKLSKVVAGCMRVKDSGVTPDGLMQFVETCIDTGVTSFDHAPVYGRYTCEEFFGDNILKKNPALRNKMQLITKTGITLPETEGNKHIYYNSTSSAIINEVEQSLRKLSTDRIDLLLIHRPDPMSDPEDTAKALEKLVESGKVLYVGVSNFSPAQIGALQSYLSIPLITNQIELSAKNPENFFNGSVDDAFMRRMFLMAWSPLGGGSLFNGADKQSVRLREYLSGVALNHGVTMDIILYAWLFTHPADIFVVTGTLRTDRIRDAVKALDITLSRDEWYGILEASRGYPVP